jgi:hypothetical protein
MGDFLFGSPLALAFAQRAMARYCLGAPGWGDDLRQAVAMARSADAMSYATVVTYVYLVGIPYGVLRADDPAVREIEEALHRAERSGDDLALTVARTTLGVALMHRTAATDHNHGRKLLTEAKDVFLQREYLLGELPLVNAYLAQAMAGHGDRDSAITLMRSAVNDLARQRQLLGWGIPATGLLVSALLDRRTNDDVAQAKAAVAELERASAEEDLAMREIWVVRLQALLARADGEDTVYRDYRDRHRDMAKTLGYQGHIDWAETLP